MLILCCPKCGSKNMKYNPTGFIEAVVCDDCKSSFDLAELQDILHTYDVIEEKHTFDLQVFRQLFQEELNL